MYDSPPVVAEDHQYEQDFECRSRNREKVHGAFVHMVVQECPPGLGRRLVVRFSIRHQAGDCPLGNIVPEFGQLTMNPWRAPCRIGHGHLFDEIPDLRVDFRPSRDLGFEFPEELETLAMPADHGVGLDDVERFAPAGPEPGEDDPEEPGDHPDFWPLVLLLINCQLLAKRDVLCCKIRGEFEPFPDDRWEILDKFDHEIRLTGRFDFVNYSGKYEFLRGTGIYIIR